MQAMVALVPAQVGSCPSTHIEPLIIEYRVSMKNIIHVNPANEISITLVLANRLAIIDPGQTNYSNRIGRRAMRFICMGMKVQQEKYFWANACCFKSYKVENYIVKLANWMKKMKSSLDHKKSYMISQHPDKELQFTPIKGNKFKETKLLTHNCTNDSLMWKVCGEESSGN